MFILTRQKIIRLMFWWLVVIPAIPFVLITLGISVYVYWPRDFSSVSQFTVAQDVEYVTLSAHGVHDTSASWGDELQQWMTTTPYPQMTGVTQQNHSIDWQYYSDSVFTCSVVGKKIGTEIGKRLAALPRLKAIHAIGHSCGSFVVLGICQGAKSVAADLLVQTTYLDPVSVYSGFFWDYGIDNFGSCADFSDNYIDTRDTVPGSNQALPNAITFDVSERQTVEYADIPPHAWPTRYYINAFRAKKVPLLYKGDKADFSSLKKGQLIKVASP
ncbi:hypothetical protein RS130_08670 [Paraglaciecola aquimarina]|uniref:Uncharacterized protein n=1 Tax=Paraglaciecola aquimarina TaxID=1235557 RepID=A0ABU3SVG5_9ALTE|nr:hypothetical protein [Paraglaciecola aquimarina]MDU0353994.1 hypothetical protein [Paraglaciecola aquimarina]